MKKTFFDKWKEEHPGPHVGMGYPPDCPCSYGYEKESNCEENHRSCAVCWNREIPEEKRADKKTIYAHMGFSEEQAEEIEKLNEGKKTPNEVREMFGLPRISSEKGDIPNERIVYRRTPLPEDSVLGEPEQSIDEWMDEKAKHLAELTKQAFEVEKNTPHILDSGARREFGTGAVRDIQEGKGRCDLLPLDVVGQALGDEVIKSIHSFVNSGDERLLYCTLSLFNEKMGCDKYTLILEVAIHFEEGTKKYGENNWQKGIPVHCYIDSAVRHYLKFLRGDEDEPHDRAFCWNIMCAIWTCKHKPELNDYAQRDTSEVEEALG